MKILAGVIAVLSGLGLYITPIWTVVEFILYLVKDKPFNWWSLWSIIICCISYVIFSIIEQMQKPNDKQINRKSGWQQRMDEMKLNRQSK